jgi:hypothetical protein
MLLATASNIETKYGFYDFLLIIRYWICVLSRPFLAYRTAFSSILLLMSHVVVSLMLTSTCMSFKATANWIRMPIIIQNSQQHLKDLFIGKGKKLFFAHTSNKHENLHCCQL